MGKRKQKEVTINADALQNDARVVAKQRNRTVSNILAVNNLNSGTFGHIKGNHCRISGRMGVEPNPSYGVVSVDKYIKICDIFGLDSDKYLVTTKKEETSDVENADELKAELQAMRESIQDIGKIATQSMMYLKRLCEIWDKE